MKLAKLLLERGADVNNADFVRTLHNRVRIGAPLTRGAGALGLQEGTTALFTAASHGRVELVRLLLTAGTDINVNAKNTVRFRSVVART